VAGTASAHEVDPEKVAAGEQKSKAIQEKLESEVAKRKLGEIFDIIVEVPKENPPLSPPAAKPPSGGTPPSAATPPAIPLVPLRAPVGAGSGGPQTPAEFARTSVIPQNAEDVAMVKRVIVDRGRELSSTNAANALLGQSPGAAAIRALNGMRTGEAFKQLMQMDERAKKAKPMQDLEAAKDLLHEIVDSRP